jgi:hypothetical protein
MYVALDTQQTEVLREVLDSSLKQLRTESAHTDSREFRDMLHRRERILEQLVSKLAVEPPTVGM